MLLAGATFGLGLAVRRWRVPRWCAWLGMISYSVYLLHPLVFNAYRSVPVLHRTHTMPDQVLFFAGLIAVIIGLSALTYYLDREADAAARPPGGGPVRPTPRTPPWRRLLPAWDDGADAAATRSASSSTAVAGGSGGSP